MDRMTEEAHGSIADRINYNGYHINDLFFPVIQGKASEPGIYDLGGDGCGL